MKTNKILINITEDINFNRKIRVWINGKRVKNPELKINVKINKLEY